MGDQPTPTPAAPDAEDVPAGSPVAGRGVDPLHALFNLDLDAVETLTKTVDVPLKDGTVIPWTFGIIDQQAIEEIRERCTKWVRKPGARKERVQELDEAAFSRELIVEATTAPDLTDRRLATKFQARTTADMLDQFLKPGTVQKLSNQVLDFSGYDDEELVAEGKG